MIKALPFVKTTETSFTTDLRRQKALPRKRCDDLCFSVVLFPRNESLIVRTSETGYEQQFQRPSKARTAVKKKLKERTTTSERNIFIFSIC